jgi:predicted RNase H-like HicB family nuclease
MLYPIAIEAGDEQHAYGVTVPDLPGCFSAGDTMEEAIANAKEAITGHIGVRLENGKYPTLRLFFVQLGINGA